MTLKAPWAFLNGHARVYTIDREQQRRHVFQMLKASGKDYSDEHCRKEAERIVEMCSTVTRR